MQHIRPTLVCAWLLWSRATVWDCTPVKSCYDRPSPRPWQIARAYETKQGCEATRAQEPSAVYTDAYRIELRYQCLPLGLHPCDTEPAWAHCERK